MQFVRKLSNGERIFAPRRSQPTPMVAIPRERGVPREIFFLKISDPVREYPRTDKPPAVKVESPQNIEHNTSLTNTLDTVDTCDDGFDGWSHHSFESYKRCPTVRHHLWKSAESEVGPIARLDEMCFDGVVHMMSLSEGARTKEFDDMLNRGEF